MSSADLALMGTTAQMVLLELQVFQALIASLLVLATKQTLHRTLLSEQSKRERPGPVGPSGAAGPTGKKEPKGEAGARGPIGEMGEGEDGLDWWNELPAALRTAESLTIFRKRLKTHLFRVHLDSA
ncbi:unnamed protein product [Arctogadus glacialis]